MKKDIVFEEIKNQTYTSPLIGIYEFSTELGFADSAEDWGQEEW